MTIQVLETGELVELMTEVEAERITSRIADKLDTIADNLEQVMPLIREALTREAWRALGYTGATAYVSDRFAKALGRLPRDVRQPVVMELSAAGMSTRAIAPIVGVTQQQVQRDTQMTHVVSPETGSYWTPEPDEPKPSVQGLDGKSYPRTAPSTEPKRKPLTDQFFTTAYDLSRMVERIERLTEDDRFPRNKDQVAFKHKGDLITTAETLARVIEKLN